MAGMINAMTHPQSGQRMELLKVHVQFFPKKKTKKTQMRNKSRRKEKKKELVIRSEKNVSGFPVLFVYTVFIGYFHVYLTK